MNLFTDCAYESLNKYGEELCGDKVEFVKGKDFTLAVLADGLGSGVKANILSTLTSKIIATMLANGSSLRDAVETIASTLPVCSVRGIAYSTFTIMHVQDNGNAYIAEFDNPNLVFMRDNQILELDRQELDIDGKKIYMTKMQMQPNDLMIAFSDGVVHAGVGCLLDLGWHYDNIVKYIKENIVYDMSPTEIARKILLTVNTLYMNKCGDDSTVCVLKIKKALPVTIMVGPPVHPEDDETVGHKLVDADGLKVVCGGTTSQIVSRVTGNPLDVSIDYYNPAVPPTAEIKGIDMVTEGVLTLGKAAEIIKNYLGASEEKWDIYSLNKKDGATRLAKIWLQECTSVNFLVGRALNPAHQNPDLPVNLSLKLNLIKEIVSILQELGKRVTVEYF